MRGQFTIASGFRYAYFAFPFLFGQLNPHLPFDNLMRAGIAARRLLQLVKRG